jgi:hypothetical protein
VFQVFHEIEFIFCFYQRQLERNPPPCGRSCGRSARPRPGLDSRPPGPRPAGEPVESLDRRQADPVEIREPVEPVEPSTARPSRWSRWRSASRWRASTLATGSTVGAGLAVDGLAEILDAGDRLDAGAGLAVEGLAVAEDLAVGSTGRRVWRSARRSASSTGSTLAMTWRSGSERGIIRRRQARLTRARLA